MSVHVGLNYRIRAAVPADFRRILRCLRRAYGKARPLPAAPFDRGFLAECDGDVVGVLAYSLGSDGFRLEAVAVDPVRQGRGVGSALIRFAEEEALLAGCDSIAAQVPEEYAEALAVCERLGYRPVERRSRAGSTVISLRKALT